MKTSGVLLVGAFDNHMSNNRFNEIFRNLHFCGNKRCDDTTDRAWNVRKIIQVLQKTVLVAWTLTSRFSFDEGVLPSSSRRNPTRTCMPDTPHR